VYLPDDALAGVAVRDYAPNGFIQAASIQGIAFGSHTRPDARIETGAAAHADDAALLLAAGTAIVQTGSTSAAHQETFRVSFADLPAYQVGFFFDSDPRGGHFDEENIVLAVQSVVQAIDTNPVDGNSTTPSNVARGAATALIHVAQTFDQERNVEDAVVQRIDVRGDGAWIQTGQYVAQAITRTGPLGDLLMQSSQGLTKVTAPSIFGSIIVGGPSTGTVQTTGQRTGPITGAVNTVPADLGRLFVTQTNKGPVLTTTTVSAHGGGLTGAVIVRGNLISQMTFDGGVSGLIAVQGNLNETNAVDKNGHGVRLGGILSNRTMAGQMVVLGTTLT
jgi:hypothetical protein